MHDLDLTLPDEAATLALGAALAACVLPGMVVYLDGDLGSGKTTLVRGLLRALGDAGPVKSPTYTLVELHAVSGLNLYHFDFYRFNQPEEYLDAGLDEYFSGKAVCLVEWPERAAPYLPAPDLRIRLAMRGAGREARIEAFGERGRRCLTNSALPAAKFSASPPPA
ncbi:MAG: tRNA (adenosine(37)-N6)-threonylcarbamoyltransferase complex ATPase subunit type 1 TsaE [Candidatus Nitricoxidivorans perseverans]|uniref:tRNA threonylcarbamoyladenosine biosynthesis protein TsaE n=1 Tax=Candidatus Nitricoxidivorans perseverans TaxID=2975601 RepID=A0AA49IXZ2_9PROT|nr:MAG: tRNA (adenosine(37)-N6)-threonylcarbamoyltransferase complex ATPase subunit type 1 TsaE [Candidatus Nitricoxidivorans perseverans]